MNNMDTLLNPDFTYQLDRISCMKGGYYAHVTFCYLIFHTGIACFSVRVVPSLKWTHVWFGRAYIIAMLWGTATALLIHNTGMPPATLVSLLWALGGMTIAWVMIKFHELNMDRLAFERVQKDIAVNGLQGTTDLRARVAAEKGKIAASKTFRQRFISIKAAHGIIMFVSWINIAGRVFATDPSGGFSCYTYPAYKPINTKDFAGANSTTITLLPARDPDYDSAPWAKLGVVGWGACLLLGPLVGAALVGAAWSLWEAKRAGRSAAKTQPIHVQVHHLAVPSAASAAGDLVSPSGVINRPEKVIEIRKSVEVGVSAA